MFYSTIVFHMYILLMKCINAFNLSNFYENCLIINIRIYMRIQKLKFIIVYVNEIENLIYTQNYLFILNLYV